MRFTILSADNVGMALGRALTRRGKTGVFCVPEPLEYAGVAGLAGIASLNTTAEAIAASNFVILDVPCATTAQIARSGYNWRGQVLVGAANPPTDGLTGWSLGTTPRNPRGRRKAPGWSRHSTPAGPRTGRTRSMAVPIR